MSRKIRDLGIGSVGAFLLATTAGTLIYVRSLANIFSSDPAVIDMFEECRFENLVIAMVWKGLNAASVLDQISSPKKKEKKCRSEEYSRI